jgi:hypothetical protein
MHDHEEAMGATSREAGAPAKRDVREDVWKGSATPYERLQSTDTKGWHLAAAGGPVKSRTVRFPTDRSWQLPRAPRLHLAGAK